MSDLENRAEPTRVMSTGQPPVERTMVAPAGGALPTQMGGGLDAYRTQVGMTLTCPICKAATPASEIYCGDCGFLLASPTEGEIEVPVEETPAAELVDGESGRRYRLREGANTLGRQGTDILVNEGTVSRAHARIFVENGEVTVEDLGSSNGTKVGDRRLSANAPTTAAHGTPLRFGNWRVTLEIAGMGPVPTAGAAEPTIVTSDRTIVNGDTPPETPAPAPVEAETPAESAEPALAMLRLTEGPGKDIPIREETITIGRRAGNSIILSQDAYISGKHVEIFTDVTGTYLMDVGSTNGTVVNGQKLVPNERQLLLDGDEVQIGQGKYRFALAEPAPPPEAAPEQPVVAPGEESGS